MSLRARTVPTSRSSTPGRERHVSPHKNDPHKNNHDFRWRLHAPRWCQPLHLYAVLAEVVVLALDAVALKVGLLGFLDLRQGQQAHVRAKTALSGAQKTRSIGSSELSHLGRKSQLRSLAGSHSGRFFCR